MCVLRLRAMTNRYWNVAQNETEKIKKKNKKNWLELRNKTVGSKLLEIIEASN